MHKRLPGKRAASNTRQAKAMTRQIKSCKNEMELIADYVVANLSPRLLSAFEQHLQACPDCAAFLRTYKKTIEITRSFLKTQSSKDFPDKLMLRRPTDQSHHQRESARIVSY